MDNPTVTELALRVDELQRRALAEEYGSESQQRMLGEADEHVDELFHVLGNHSPSIFERFTAAKYDFGDNTAVVPKSHYHPLDLREVDDPAVAALLLYRDLFLVSRRIHQNPHFEVHLEQPGESSKEKDEEAWRVLWESGPWDWAVRVTCGGSLKPDGEVPFVRGIQTGPWTAEPYYGFDVIFDPIH